MSAEPGKRLHPQAYSALTEALASFQWYKADFSNMITALFAADPAVLSGIDLTIGTKREIAREIVGRLQRGEDRYQALVVGVLITLSEYDPSFPHLTRLTDGEDKTRLAQASLAEVARVVAQHKALIDDADARRAADAAAAAAAARAWGRSQDLGSLRSDFYSLSEMSDPHQRGLALEPFLNRLFSLFDLDPRGAFVLSGEQIDGAFTFDTDDYLMEARWRRDKVDPKQVRDFAGKVAEKTHRTGGLLVSIDGFTAEAVTLLRRTGSRLLLADGADLVAVLQGSLGLSELLLRKRRHANETGDPYLSARDML